MTRFLPNDIVELLPRFFSQSTANTEWLKSQDAKELVANVKKHLIDKRFEAFLNEYGMKRKK